MTMATSSSGGRLRYPPTRSPASTRSCVTPPSRQVLGDDVVLTFDGWDECNTIISEDRIAQRIAGAGAGVVFLVGVQSNQFPRAMDMARLLRARNLKVVIGGFHVSGCLSMLDDLPHDLQEALDLGVTLFAGEAEGHIDTLLQDAYREPPATNLQFPRRSAGFGVAPPRPTCPRSGCNATRHRSGRSMPVAVARSSAASARSSTCRGESRVFEPLTTSSTCCVRIWKRA